MATKISNITIHWGQEAEGNHQDTQQLHQRRVHILSALQQILSAELRKELIASEQSYEIDKTHPSNRCDSQENLNLHIWVCNESDEHRVPINNSNTSPFFLQDSDIQKMTDHIRRCDKL